MKPICVKCQRFYRPKKNGLFFIEGMPRVSPALPGLREPANWQPYKIWSGDVWECPDCHAEIIVGTGREPVAIQHEAGFRADIEALGAKLQINDC